MTSSSASSGLFVQGLTKTYANGVRAMRGVDLQVTGGMYGLLGPNGAGKSTLMRTLATLQRPDAGTFALDGVDGLQDPDAIRHKLGYLPQQIGAYPGVSATSLLERFAWLKGMTSKKQRRQEVAALLERVNLQDAAHREVTTYSGGMLRRFGIAIALLGRPRLLIVDEPTAGLDPAERNRFHRVLSEVAHDAVVLLSTHIVEDVEHLCSRLSILVDGQIVQEGTPAELRAPLADKLFTRVVARGEALPEDALDLRASPHGTRVIISSPTSPGPEYEPHPVRLEDVYYDALRQSAPRHQEEAA